ncbi:MAG: peptidyl-prolyl cis-trans isomerase [Pirellulales bacterium]
MANGQAIADPNAKIVASINGEEIQREELGREAMTRFGKPVIESIINKTLITHHCAQAGVTVTTQDVNAEIDRLARKFGMTMDDYVKMLKQERGIGQKQYADEIVWPMLALRRLASKNVQPTREEVDQMYESKYGESVKVRIIVVEDPALAKELQAAAAQNPDSFGALAVKHSKDPSASLNGLIQPVRRHVGDPLLEQTCFSLQQGQVSPVVPIQLPGATVGTPGSKQFVIVKCEGRLPAQQIDQANRAKVETTLAESIVDRKIQKEASVIFKKIEDQAKAQNAIVNVYNDDALRAQNPGIAAQVYDRRISIAELVEECIARHGSETLEIMIHRKLLGQSLKERNLSVTQDDIDTEVVHAAILMGKTDKAGRPDTKAWLEMVTKESGVGVATYIADSVWPSAALKKLTGDVVVSEEDLKKGYEANYGARVRARAIVHNNQRKLTEVWEQARQNPTLENFSRLAEANSIDPSSQALQGKVPPIQRHGGQPLIEKEAFALKPGEMSGVIDLGEYFVVMFCEGYTEPQKVTFDEVKQSIHDDVYEKKQRIVMGQAFKNLKEEARIDNYLAGTMQTPNRKVNYQQAIDAKGNPIAKQTGAATKTAQPGTAAPRR